MSKRVRIEPIGDAWAVMMFMESTGQWIPVAEWDTEEEAETDLKKWETIEKSEHAEES
ncbi:MAG: hypothetical protein K9K78_07580 [Spirochaetales bacterium]|nr:hypothetical protein [Spirochaetales bacterium]